MGSAKAATKEAPRAAATIALAGAPNVGKSTLFNRLTGLNQHTGNWPGKTVAVATGECRYKKKDYLIVDLPGTYSLFAYSEEEEIARDFICSKKAGVTIVVADATSLERGLNLTLQIREMTNSIILCVNLMDEAQKRGIRIDTEKLQARLGIPVVGMAARNGAGLDSLMDAVEKILQTPPSEVPHVKLDSHAEAAVSRLLPYVCSRWEAFVLLLNDAKVQNPALAAAIVDAKAELEANGITPDMLHETISVPIIREAEAAAREAVHSHISAKSVSKLDRLLTSRAFGLPIMALFMAAIFWLTISGANYPSQLLSQAFSWLEQQASALMLSFGAPQWLHDPVVFGVLRTVFWVVSVMLPPMAIFFPLFTILEDLGVLPRIAFNLDYFFKRARACGKQALTMCMGFGCNAAGVVGCRIIGSPRERLIAIITNNFVPCNGRFPTLIAMSSLFFGGAAYGVFGSVLPALAVCLTVMLGVVATMAVSRLLSATLLRGLPSSFVLELPPYRKPQIGRIIVRSILDRTLFVLGRAVAVAAPAGLVIWLMANITAGGQSLLSACAGFLEPLGRLMGLDGRILLAFILGLPANEIVVPIIVMSYLGAGTLVEAGGLAVLRDIFVQNGWTWLTAVNVMLFSLMHFPCATTLWTIKKETGGIKWAIVSFLVPTALGMLLCIFLTFLAKLFGLA